MNEPESNTDWEDRLVDLALEESLGGQAPPNLSENILAASNSAPIASVELRELAMNDIQHVKISRRKHWAMFAAAASLLVAVGTLVFMEQFGVRRARMADTTKPEQKEEASGSSLERSRTSVESQSQSNQELNEESDLTLDFDAALPAGEVKNEDELMLMVTPHIITDGEQSVELDVGTDAAQTQQLAKDQSGEFFDSSSRSGDKAKLSEHASLSRRQASNQGVAVNADESGTVASAPAQVDTKTRNLDQPFRISTFGKPTEGLDASGPAPAGGIGGGGGGAIGSSRVAGQTPSSTPATAMGRAKKIHLEDLPRYSQRDTGAPSSAEVQESIVGAVQRVARVKPESKIGADSGAAPAPARGRVSTLPPDFVTKNKLLAEMKSELEAKHNEYLKFSMELDASTSATESAVLGMNANDSLMIQQQILAKKQELVDLEMTKQLAVQSANSPAALEKAIAKELKQDPDFQNFQQKQYAHTQQLRQLKSIAKGKRNSPEIKRLQDQLAILEKQSQEFRSTKASELRDRLKGAPNEFLQNDMMEYFLRKQSIDSDIADLEKQYENKLNNLEESGHTSSKLAIINSEIEQLAELTRRLESGIRTEGDTAVAPTNVRVSVNAELGRKIAEYQQLARMYRGWGYRESNRLPERVSILSAEIEDLRRIKRRYDAQQGIGPGTSGDQYARIYENPFVQTKTTEENFSTFSIDVDTASYANVRQFLMQNGQLPPPDAVRLEELVNYFDYDYSGPTGDVPFASHVEVAGCPWNAEHRLVRIGIKGREIERNKRPQSNLVFLIDVSGSMNEPTKLPLLVEGMKLLTRELGENDKVAIVVYASSEGLALESTRGDKQQQILSALDKLRAGGSTAGGAGIELAYKTAVKNHIEGGVNRVILCTDGDFNVGVTSPSELERMAEENAKETGVFLTVLGFGRGNLNDSMMEKISGKGNGNYHYVDNLTEARKVLVEEMAGTLVTIAKDVKIQIDFNPYQVAGYRLLGYENRMLRTEDFNDDKKDAGEIGAGHTVTALYEIVPAGKSVDVPPVDASKYVKPVEKLADESASAELLTLRIRYKQPDADTSTKQEFPVTDEGGSFAEATPDFQFASAVASFGMLLRDSEHKGNTSYAAVKEIAQGASERDQHGYRAEFLLLLERASQLSGE